MQRTYQLSEIVPTRADSAMAALLTRAGRRSHFASGSFIQQRGDENDGFWLVEAGAVSIRRFGRDGEATIYAVLGAGDLFGELAHFTGVSRQVDAVAETDATLLRIDARSIDRLLGQEPDFARWLLKSLGNQLRTALDRIESDRHLSAQARVARVLHDMVRRDGPQLQTTQEALANFVGFSRVTIGKILGDFARSGLIKLGYRTISVTNAAGLAERAALSRD
jgi:CRP-like cAMP-binding protein